MCPCNAVTGALPARYRCGRNAVSNVTGNFTGGIAPPAQLDEGSSSILALHTLANGVFFCVLQRRAVGSRACRDFTPPSPGRVSARERVSDTVCHRVCHRVCQRGQTSSALAGAPQSRQRRDLSRHCRDTGMRTEHARDAHAMRTRPSSCSSSTRKRLGGLSLLPPSPLKADSACRRGKRGGLLVCLLLLLLFPP